MRIEHKYLITAQQKVDLLNLCQIFLQPNLRHRYGLASIYFDRWNRQSFSEKEEGLTVRDKLRFRAYSYNFYSAPTGYVEIKSRNGDWTGKTKFSLPMMDLKKCINGDWEPVHASAYAADFLRFTTDLQLEPVVMISYMREAYVGRFEADFRLTLDSFVSAFDPRHPASGSYMHAPNQLIIPEDKFVLEVKTPGIVPVWYFDAVKKLGLERKSISKFYLGVQSLAVRSETMAVFKTKPALQHLDFSQTEPERQPPLEIPSPPTN